jgi:hypothetical protein
LYPVRVVLLATDYLGAAKVGFDWFFLAMAHGQLGEKEQAHKWYAKAMQWMDKNKPQDEELRRFRAEASALLGIGDALKLKAKEGSPGKD